MKHPLLRIDSTVLSHLLSQCANATHDNEGFLLGEVLTRTTHVLSDEEKSQEQHTTLLVIHGFHCLSSCLLRPYDSYGTLFSQVLQDQLDCIKGQGAVVGYFKYRHGTDLTLSVRDTLLAEELEALLQIRCFALLTSTDQHTLDMNFAFWKPKGLSGKQERLPVDIVNRMNSAPVYSSYVPSTFTVSLASSSIALQESMANTLAFLTTRNYDTLYSDAMQAFNDAAVALSEKTKEWQTLQDQLNMGE